MVHVCQLNRRLDNPDRITYALLAKQQVHISEHNLGTLWAKNQGLAKSELSLFEQELPFIPTPAITGAPGVKAPES
ncbi:MAG TPA: hypothetical protein VL793_01370 [Patescibacteria group bacterium]|nr:hypothetical protein [Patescibacteria group bacterium]